ncbi:hypothetical protein [uncultured Serinicoccus sp.]|uniref:hypothetical protein n=1 Tax=uncultured Serinicoccus sp. TaxID=735514 RepID=UPI002609E8F9|nr:hypothetical protein [uncultured Serinicoccus sp.]
MDAIYEHHCHSNNLPRVHQGQRMVDPATGVPVTIDQELVPLITALWASGIRAVASCQNLAEYVETAWPDRLPEILADETSPLSHAGNVRHRLAYVRVVTDTPAAEKFIEQAAPLLEAVRRLDQLVQLEFSPEQVPSLLATAHDIRGWAA